MIEECLSYIHFLIIALHLSKKYNLKFQKRLYQDLIETYCYKNKLNIKKYILDNKSYLNYNNLNYLYKYTKEICKKDNSENLMKYAYIYCCYKLRKENNKVIVLMILDHDFIIYNCNNNLYENYKKKDLKIYEYNFHNVKSLPGYSSAYYLLGKLYEQEAKKEFINEIKKKKLIDISSYCYYLCYKTCPFLICSFKKLLLIHSNFYSCKYMEEIKKISKFYNFRFHTYGLWKYGSIKKQEEHEKKYNSEFDNNILELIELEGKIKNINIKSSECILSLIEEEKINNFFLNWMEILKDANVPINNKSKFISKEAIYDISTIGNFYFYLYSNNIKKSLFILDEWKNQPIFSILIFYFKGLCYFLLRNYEKSAFFFEKVHDIEHYYTKHLPILSTCYWHLKKLSKIEYILISYPKKEINEYFLCLIGNYFSLKNKKELASYFFRKATEFNTLYEYSYILYSCEMKNLGKIRKAVIALSKCLHINPCNYKAHLLLSVILFQSGNSQLANIHLSLSLKLNTTDPLICLYSALLYDYNEKYETALLCLEHAKKNYYEGIDFYVLQGIIFLKMKRNLDALNSFLKAQNIYPNNNYINTYIALTLALEKKFEKSKKIIKEIVLQNPNNMNRRLLEDIYKCCNLKIIPDIYVLNKINFHYK
ncbi:anaphase promoting complex subunit, putative [Plasmodium gallinaceum]|uniref:Anaphase promoting complex subunit, putative n=1 Tax=Plasmodium gallinaceum TaxID=5849 RepID=A0A1J1GYY5_PLAGA|nr:anaphase promoting complex subunit, putative [Plasmodium gallinaceum]CRG97794.1 anaphase promoting complex subunit, putative [Plasmodium gallinaceum]